MIIVDWSHMMYRYLYANLGDVREKPAILGHLLVNGLINISTNFKATKDRPLVLAIDGKRKDGWRKEFFDENAWQFEDYQETEGYKGHRKVDDTIPWDEIYLVMDDIKELLINHTDFNVIEHKRAEADDVIYVSTRKSKDVVIVSSDKDFKQLISDDVKMYDPIKKVYIKESNPEEYLVKHILIGDSADNIKPCRKRLGPKTADKMLKNIEAHLEIDDQLRERYAFNKKLIDLTELPSDIFNDISDSIGNITFDYSPVGIMNFCRKYRLKELGKRVDKLQLR